MNAMISFVLGILSGGFILYLLSKRYWRQNFKVEKQKLSRWFSERLKLEISRKNELEEEKQIPFKKFNLERRDYLLLQKQYEQFEQESDGSLTDFREQIINLKNGNQNLRDEKEQLSLRKEQLALENGRLTHGKEQMALENEQLALEKNQLEDALKKASLQLESANQTSHQEKNSQLSTSVKLNKIIRILFPNLIFLRNSIELIDREFNSFIPLISRLQLIHNGDFTDCIKVRATDNEWFEYRAQKGNMMMRIYFQKCKSNKNQCQVLLAIKKNQKTQNRDYDWLKKQPSC